MSEPARTIVYRHPCDCAGASRPLIEGEHSEHRFDVDGEPFPWHITEAGATFSKHGDIYLCRVTLFLVDHDGRDVDFRLDSQQPRILLDGNEFPWMAYRFDLRGRPPRDLTLDIAFLAEHVDTDGPIT